MPLDQNQLGLLRRADRILEEAEKADGDDADAAARVHEIVDTCLENLHGVEVQCACHVFGSTALQRVLKHSNSSQRAALAAPLFSSPPRALLTDKYGSHAVEALLASVLPELRGATELDPEGVPALFKGVGPRISIIGPLFAVALYSYEVQKWLMKEVLHWV